MDELGYLEQPPTLLGGNTPATTQCAMALLAAGGEGNPVPSQTKCQWSSARDLPSSTVLGWAINQPRADAAHRLLTPAGPSTTLHPEGPTSAPTTSSTHHQSHVSLQLPVALRIPAAQRRGVSDAQQPELQGQHMHRLCGKGEAGGVGCRGFHPCGARFAPHHQLSWAEGLYGGCREMLHGCGGALGSDGATGHDVGIGGHSCGHSQGLGAEQGAGCMPSSRRSRQAGWRCPAGGGSAVPRLRAMLQSRVCGAGGRHRAWAGRGGPWRSCWSGSGSQ